MAELLVVVVDVVLAAVVLDDVLSPTVPVVVEMEPVELCALDVAVELATVEVELWLDDERVLDVCEAADVVAPLEAVESEVSELDEETAVEPTLLVP